MSCTKCEKLSAPTDLCFDRMADGRIFTDIRPHCVLYSDFTGNNIVGSSFDQRKYLIDNATKIMEEQRNGMPTALCVNCKTISTENGTVLPEQSQQYCTKNYCTFRTNDSAGLGLGRSFYDQKNSSVEGVLETKNNAKVQF